MSSFRTIIGSMCVLCAFALFSCENDNPDGGPDITSIGNSIYLPNEAGASVSVDLEFDTDWFISNKTTWFTIQPLSGVAGPATISVAVLEDNPDLREKEASFVITTKDASGQDVGTQYYVIQDVTPGFNIANKVAAVNETAQTYTFTLEGNVKYEAVPDVDWVTINSITYDSTKLQDNQTYSKYMVSHIEMSIEANTGDVRSAQIALQGVDGETNETIEISQYGEVSADFKKDFYRRSFLMKCTATWCGPCGTASNQIHAAEGQRPGRMLWSAFYTSSSYGELAEWTGVNNYFNTVGISGWPTMVFNNYVSWAGATDYYVKLIDESVAKSPASTNIAGIAAINSGNIELGLNIASKETMDANVSILILEDSVEHYQAAQGNNYIHNNIARGEMTQVWGDKISLTANTITKLNYSAAIPSYILNQDNLHLYVIVYKEGKFVSSVAPNADYGTIVDNVADIPVNGFTLFEYEE